jgi:uncharacterized membrane protein YcaP (DUF421 family)
MIEMLWEQFQSLLGLGSDVGTVGIGQMALRTIVIYLVTLAIVRLGSKRFLSESTAFDVIVSIMLGSVMSRAINGSAPFLPTLAAGVILLALHWLFAILAYRTNWFGSLIKGNAVLLIKDGEIQQQGMRRTGITSNDLAQALRLQTNQSDSKQVKSAYLERNGRISIIPYEREPHIFEISVEEGVQTVRIELLRTEPVTQSSNKAGRVGLNND